MEKPRTDREPLDRLAEEFAHRSRRGEDPSVDEYAKKYPEWANELRELLPAVSMMEELKRHRRQSRGATTEGKILERLGDYRIVREVARGGMGIVYEAVQESLGRRVALKILPPHALLDRNKLERFHLEAQAAAGLHHTNIVPVFGVGEEDGLHYYVMQFIDGESLDRILSRWKEGSNGSRPSDSGRWRKVAEIGVQVARALEHAHREGTLHRDIKPANLLRDSRETIWITDFGLAKLDERMDLTHTGDVLGTLQYMAPESFHGEADARSDVYSLGLTLYELTTLKAPYEGASTAQLLRRIGKHKPVRPRKLDPAIPRDLETAILKSTALDPNHRYSSARELAEDLDRFLADRPIRARRVTAAERLWRWCRRNRTIATLGAATLASLILAAIVGWVGYANTMGALEREAIQSARAEANVQLSLEAFEEIFDNMTPEGWLNPGRMPIPRPRGPQFPADVSEDAALLRSVLDFYDRFAEQNSTNSELQLEAAKAHRRVGTIYQQLGQLEDSEASFARATALCAWLASEFPSEPEYRFELAETHAMNLVVWEEPDRLIEAEKRLREGVALHLELATDHPDVHRYSAALARAHSRLGAVLQHLERDPEAEASLLRSIEIHRALVAVLEDPLFIVRLCNARDALTRFFLSRDRLTEARCLAEESIEDLRAACDADAAFALRMGANHLSIHFTRLAEILSRMGETELSDEAFRKASLHRSREFPGGPGPTRNRRDRFER